jgi:diguanylate cyclase (GGDEF)-like protein
MEKSGSNAHPFRAFIVCCSVRIVSESKTFSGIERRRNPGGEVELPNATEVSIFHELGKALTSSLQLDQVLRTIMEKINEFLRPDTWSLLLMDQEKNELYFQIATGAGAEALRDVRIKLGQGIAGWVAQSGEVIVVPDTSKDSRFFAKVDEKTKMETRSIVAVPVRFRDQCLGVIELINCIGEEGFSPRDLALLEALADYAAIAIENARHVHRIHELTIKDDCTCLYNARHLNFILDTEIYRSNRYAFEFSLLFIDLDHFKAVNDTHGHLVGSRLLGEVGEMIKNSCRQIDMAFRYGGDEFVVLLPQTSKENAIRVAHRLHKRIRDTIWLKAAGLEVKITASVGVASYPGDSKTKADLLHLADEAMYNVKNTTRDAVLAATVNTLPIA